MKNKFTLFFAAIILLSLIGCSCNINVSGTVKYADGSVLPAGMVVFGNGKCQYLGDIKNDGTFKMGGIKTGSGIPKGQYKVWLANTTIVEYKMKKMPTVKMLRTNGLKRCMLLNNSIHRKHQVFPQMWTLLTKPLISLLNARKIYVTHVTHRS
jgi:hypothetical protein